MSEWDRARRLLDEKSAASIVRGGSDDGRSVMNDHRIAIDEETDHAHDDRHPLTGRARLPIAPVAGRRPVMDASLGTEFGIGGAWLAEYTLTAIGSGVVVFDVMGRAVQWDRTAADLLGVSEERLAGRPLHDAEISARWQDGARLTSADDPVLAVIESGERSCGLTIGVDDDGGTVAWRSITMLPICGVGGATRAVLASLTDITALVESRSIRASWHLALRKVMRSGLPPTLLIDRDGTILECNEQVLQLTDRTELELLDCRFTDICDVDVTWLWDELDELDDSGLAGPTWALHRDGHEIPVQGRFSSIDHPDLGRVAMAQLLAPTFVDA